MDFSSLCKKVNMESIRAKLRPLPALPVIPTLKSVKIPKSLSKLKSRKIFGTSNENVNKNSKTDAADPYAMHMERNFCQLPPPPPPPADFIKLTPTRISTISSLVHTETIEQYRGSGTNTYRSAESVDDDYAMTSQQQRQRSRAKPVSPIRGEDISGTAAPGEPQTFTQVLQKRCKDIADFKFKHIFAKRTVVRKDDIVVDHYVRRYNDDLANEKLEAELRDSEIAEDYRIHFTLSRQNTAESNGSSGAEARRAAESLPQRSAVKTVAEDSGDESGMEVSPPVRKRGIAATRFAKVLNPAKRMSLEYDEQEEAEVEKLEITRKKTASTKTIRKKENLNEEDDEDGEEYERGAKKPPQRAAKTEDAKMSASSEAISAIRNNCQRFKRSMLRRHSNHTSTDESGDEGSPNKKSPTKTKTQKLKMKMRHLRAKEETKNNNEKEKEKEKEAEKSDVKSTFNNKLQIWKKSFKRGSSVDKSNEQGEELEVEQRAHNESDEHGSPGQNTLTHRLSKWKKNLRRNPSETSVDEQHAEANSPPKPSRSDTLIKKLKYIRQRKATNSVDDLDNDEGAATQQASTKAGETKAGNFEEKFQKARKRTLKKVNETMQQFKRFQTTQQPAKTPQDDDNEAKQQVAMGEGGAAAKRKTSVATLRSSDSDEEEEDEDEDYEQHNSALYLSQARAKWTTNPILSESLDTDDVASEFPTVLIHQDNSDFFESTLIISVTRPSLPTSPTPSAKITEIYEQKEATTPLKWISNEEIISGFQANNKSVESMRDSSASCSNKDSAVRRASAADVDAASDPWLVKSQCQQRQLVKCKSIDIFDVNRMSAFENFDKELSNEPIVRIEQPPANEQAESCEEYDAAEDDEDNCSRVTKIEVKAASSCIQTLEDMAMATKSPALRKIGNSQESLITQANESEDYASNDDDDADFDRPPSAAPSPPPSESELDSMPDSLIIASPAIVTTAVAAAVVALPGPKPPIAARKPARSASIQPKPTTRATNTAEPTAKRIARPLVKTSSLRLAYNEQPRVTDVGKVNKLISQFEQPQGDKEGKEKANTEANATRSSPIKLLLTKPPRAMKKNKTRSAVLEEDDANEATPMNSESEEVVGGRHSLTLDNIALTASPPSCDLNENLKTSRSSSRNSLHLDSNLNYSYPNSVYGSPPTHPSSLLGSPDFTPTPDRRQKRTTSDTLSAKQKRRSVTRETDSYYSFDSDEENSYYSISSSTSSSRYVVEI